MSSYYKAFFSPKKRKKIFFSKYRYLTELSVCIVVKEFAFKPGTDDELVQEVSTTSWKHFRMVENAVSA